MLVLFVLSLLTGFALGLRLMLRGVLKESDPATGGAPGGAAQRRMRARVVSPVATAVLAAFGLTGAVLVRGLGWSARPSLFAALAMSAAAAMLAAWVRSWALDPRAPVDPDDDPRYVVQGLPALVTRAIAAARAGEVTWRRDGRTEVTPARSIDGADVAEGTDVVIERLEDGVAWIETWGQVEARL